MVNLRKKIMESEGKELPLEDFRIIEYPEIKTLNGPEMEQGITN